MNRKLLLIRNNVLDMYNFNIKYFVIMVVEATFPNFNIFSLRKGEIVTLFEQGDLKKTLTSQALGNAEK